MITAVEADFRCRVRERLENGQRVGEIVVEMIDEFDWKTISEQKAVLIDIVVQEAQAVESNKRRAS